MKVNIFCLLIICLIGSSTEQYRYRYVGYPSYYSYYRLRYARPWRLTYYKLRPPPHVNHPPPPRPRLVYKAKQQPRKPRWPDVLIQWTLPWIG